MEVSETQNPKSLRVNTFSIYCALYVNLVMDSRIKAQGKQRNIMAPFRNGCIMLEII